MLFTYLKKYLIIFLLAAFFVIVYLPYILRGGFIIDDWSVVFLAKNTGSFWQNYTSWFPLFSNRPLAPLILTILSRLYGAWPPAYIATNLLFLFLSGIITGSVIKRYVNESFLLLFIFFLMMPVISSAVIFSPVMQVTAPFSYLLWAISFYLQDKYRREKKNSKLFFSYLFILAALMVYEIILPLLIFSVLFPLYTEYFEKNEKISLKRLSRQVLPIIIILILTILYQKFIMPHFMVVYSRINSDFSSAALKLVWTGWNAAVFHDFPMLLLAAISYFKFSLFRKMGIILFFTFLIALYFLREKIGIETKSGFFKKKNIYLFIIFTVVFIGSSSIYIFSGRIATISGYENRGLSATWFSLSLLFAFLGSRLLKTKIRSVIILGFLFVVFLAFIAQRNNYLKSYQLQNNIISDLLKKDEIAKSKGNFIVGNVPRYVSSNFNDEEVFNYFWDFGTMAKLKSGGAVRGGYPLTFSRAIDINVSMQGESLLIGTDCRTKMENIWYYKYDQMSRISSLRKIGNIKDMEKLLVEVRSQGLDNSNGSYFMRVKNCFENRGLLEGLLNYARL
jgi:hypothetical protein